MLTFRADRRHKADTARALRPLRAEAMEPGRSFGKLPTTMRRNPGKLETEPTFSPERRQCGGFRPFIRPGLNSRFVPKDDLDPFQASSDSD